MGSRLKVPRLPLATPMNFKLIKGGKDALAKKCAELWMEGKTVELKELLNSFRVSSPNLKVVRPEEPPKPVDKSSSEETK